MDRRDMWLLLPRPVRRVPADLAVVVCFTGLTLLSVFVPVLNETPLRVVFGLIFVLFLPGYAFVAALFPEAGGKPVQQPDPAETNSESNSTKPAAVPGTEAAADESTPATTPAEPHAEQNGIDGIERVALSFGLSIAVVPLIGLGLNFTPWGIRLAPIALAVAGFTLGCVGVATIRREALPEDERFVVPYQTWIRAAREELVEPETRTDAALNVVLAVSVLLAVGSVGYAVAVPSQGEQFTEFYLLTENSDGELVADGYPQELIRGEQAELIVGVENNEYTTTNYTVIIQLQEVRQQGNETTVLNRSELDRFTVTLGHNETHQQSHTLQPTRTDEDLRVQYLLYADEVPETPTQANAYRDLHIWIDVRESSTEALRR